MKKSFILTTISLCIFHSTLSIAEELSFPQLMDSTSYYQQQQNYRTALEWAIKAYQPHIVQNDKIQLAT